MYLLGKVIFIKNREVPVPAKEEKKHSEPGLQVGKNCTVKTTKTTKQHQVCILATEKWQENNSLL